MTFLYFTPQTGADERTVQRGPPMSILPLAETTVEEDDDIEEDVEEDEVLTFT